VVTLDDLPAAAAAKAGSRISLTCLDKPSPWGFARFSRRRRSSLVVPDARKAKAVAAAAEGDIGPLAPASILRTHRNTTIYLDKRSAAMLSAAVPIVVQP
jgi:hypothetical protein